MCDGCGRDCNEFAGRVQNHHVRFSFHRDGHYENLMFLEIVKAAAERDTLGCRLCEGCHCERLPIIWRAGLERDTMFHLRCHSVQRARQPLSRLAWVASRWQGTSCSSSFVSKVLGANCKRANNFHPVAEKFAM